MITRFAAPIAALAALCESLSGGALAASQDCRAKNLDALASWGGVWMVENSETGIGGRDRPGGPPLPLPELLGLGAPWNDVGWSRFEAALRIISTNPKQAGWGFPVMMDSYAPFKFVIAPGETAIASQYREIRYVYTDGRGHPPARDVWPTIWGDSIGCWQGDVLVIDTIDVKYTPSFSAVAPPLSEHARFVERLRMAGPGRLESEITITDPETLERPWTVKVVYVHAMGLDRLVHEGDMFDNDRSVAPGPSGTIAPPRQPLSLAAFANPPEIKLPTAELDRVAGQYTIDGTPLVLKIERRGERLVFMPPDLPGNVLPLHAQGPLAFFFAGARFNFTTDPSGRVTGFTGNGPDGSPASGKRTGSP
jgi:hypothetical protein